MTRAEKTELALIAIFGSIVWLAASELPNRIEVGTAFLWGSALLLLQSLVRDLWLLANGARSMPETPARKMRCMCVESTVGAAGIFAGIALLGSGIDRDLMMQKWMWSPIAIVIMITGFAIKDYVMAWNPFRIQRDKNHMNIVFSWRK